ncbi:ParA family protein [Tessaracoccus sp. MC1865]|uniref:ParA family protein n=1 Tax=Tessaracoccus sp. MC1865 TaxID=2760310 RepID=UPI0015FFB49F|nr:ParA family protein [Tessaracoccus sp. MC1865]QTO37522.1 ParA family protein [Tessaracoccus sp. MC1865]
MALFFRKRKLVTDANELWKDHSNVSRETPPQPRRALSNAATATLEEEYGDEMVEYAAPTPTLPRPAEPRVFVVANQKGGVGKTTTTVNVAMALALGGLNVLVVDIDPQGNASTALGVEHTSGTKGTYEVLTEQVGIIEHAQPSPHSPNLHVLPAAIDLAMAELELVNERGREMRMRDAIRTYIDESGVDYIFFDCPPSLGLLTLNALVAATEILVPIQTEYYALEGVSHLMHTINRVKGNLNDDLQLSTILLTMYDPRTNLARDVAEEVRRHFPNETLEVEIPRSVKVAEAPSFGQTVMTYQPKNVGALAYQEAAEEIANRAERADA